jgi:2-dehydropantoate 2-reductase
MRIAVMGAGAVGGYFGALLAQAGHEVAFIARGEHMHAMREHGLVLEGPRGRMVVTNIEVTDDPASLAPCDVTLLCVKAYDIETACAAIRPLVARGGFVISLQNGIDGQDRANAVLGEDRALGGLAFVSLYLGHVRAAFRRGRRQPERACNGISRCLRPGRIRRRGDAGHPRRAVAKIRWPGDQCRIDFADSPAGRQYLS